MGQRLRLAIQSTLHVPDTTSTMYGQCLNCGLLKAFCVVTPEKASSEHKSRVSETQYNITPAEWKVGYYHENRCRLFFGTDII
ncbi:hypothetical protein J6590_094967 [Homalodisca vitripennis]|nr:hypothetical protein J6590_094967 [Homalodisca vitripennis]